MARLTITVDADTLRRARRRATERGESVNQFLAQRLTEYADAAALEAGHRRDTEHFVELSRDLSGISHGAGWTRSELYDPPRIGS